MQIDRRILERIATRPSDAAKQRIWEGYITALCSSEASASFDRFAIGERRIRLIMLLANMVQETGGLTILRENMSYSAPRLREVWPRWFPTLEFARQYERQPEKLANYIYGASTTIGQNLGNVHPGDGWRYRGGGLLQTTGRDGYRIFGGASGVDLEAAPEKIKDPLVSLAASCAEWGALGLNAFADAGNFRACCNGINRGDPNSASLPNGWEERQIAFRKCLRAFGEEPPHEIVRDLEILTETPADLIASNEAHHGRQTEVPLATFSRIRQY